MIRILVAVTLLLLAPGQADAQLRGHGGPVRALAISPDGTQAVSGSFDTSVIRWSLQRNAAEQVLRFHDGAVNAVALLPDGRIASSGEDARIAIWRPGEAQPSRCWRVTRRRWSRLPCRPDGTTLASASWDHTARLWPLAGGEPRVITGHGQNVNGVAFTPDGRALVTAGYDATLRISPLDNGAPIIATLPTPLNAVAVAPDGEIVTAGADGKVYVLSAAGERIGEVEAAPTPIIAIAVSGDGKLIAAAGIRGSVAIIDRALAHARTHLGRAGAAGLVGRFLPRRPHAAHRRNRPHDPALGRGDRRTDRQRGDGRAGRPARCLRRRSRCRGVSRLHRLPHLERGRRRARRAHARRHFRAPDRDLARLQFLGSAQAASNIVWTPETVSKLFEVGPMAYTPGTKMPEQRIGSAEDRAALVEFLEKATKAR